MEAVDFNPTDREQMVSHNIDATGKQWVIAPVRGRSTVEAKCTDPNVKNIPKGMNGQWTKREWLQYQISKYVNETWDKSEKQAQTQERKQKASKEQAKKD